MIEKLKNHSDPRQNQFILPTDVEIIEKINEIIDTVNAINNKEPTADEKQYSASMGFGKLVKG
jgi:hypothetical protein